MPNKKTLTEICVLLLLLPIALSIPSLEETSSVSRIVGESPTEMIRQMQRSEININHAAYYTNDEIDNKKTLILKQQFSNNVNVNWDGAGYNKFSPNDIKDAVNNFRNNNELFMLETDGMTKHINRHGKFSFDLEKRKRELNLHK